MTSNFEIVKERLDIVDVARDYGIDVNRHNKAHCPWHTDKTPSLSFKNQRFRCFGCGESGDVIDLVRLLTNQKAVDALREINASYRLGLDLDAPVSPDVIQRRAAIREQKELFDLWVKKSSLILIAYFHMLRNWKRTLYPRHPDEIIDPRYVEALHRYDFIGYVLDTIYLEGTLQDKAEFLVTHESMIRGIEQRLIWEGVDYDAVRNGTGARPAATIQPVAVMGSPELRNAA